MRRKPSRVPEEIRWSVKIMFNGNIHWTLVVDDVYQSAYSFVLNKDGNFFQMRFPTSKESYKKTNFEDLNLMKYDLINKYYELHG